MQRGACNLQQEPDSSSDLSKPPGLGQVSMQSNDHDHHVLAFICAVSTYVRSVTAGESCLEDMNRFQATFTGPKLNADEATLIFTALQAQQMCGR